MCPPNRGKVRRLTEGPQLPPTFQLAATLGPASAPSVELRWGQVVTITAAPGAHLTFSPPEVGALYTTETAGMNWFDGRWIVELSDHNTLIAVPSARINTIDEAAAKGVLVAFVELLVRSGESED